MHTCKYIICFMHKYYYSMAWYSYIKLVPKQILAGTCTCSVPPYLASAPARSVESQAIFRLPFLLIGTRSTRLWPALAPRCSAYSLYY